MEKFLGIDFGGTNIKFGVVSENGRLTYKKKYATHEAASTGDLIGAFLELTRRETEKHPSISKIGVGIPGALSKDRSRILETPNVPQLKGVDLLRRLQNAFPEKTFHLENDANAAALGELYFSKENLPDDFIFVTLGTGVGGAAILNRQIFLGGGGNAMEIGHMISSMGNTIEQKIGKKGLVNMAFVELNRWSGETALTERFPLTSKLLENSAQAGDALARQVFAEAGRILGEALVAAIRLLDVKTIVIGGGVADNYEFMKTPISETLRNYLSDYYLAELSIRKATLKNDAGIIGAAALCFLDAINEKSSGVSRPELLKG